jgi:hypothetical protein
LIYVLRFVGLHLEPSPKVKPLDELKKVAVGTFAALTIASSGVVSSNVLPANAALTTTFDVPAVSSTSFNSLMLAEKVTREGVYGEYSVDVIPQTYDDARSTFKSATETKSKKGKYTALLAILIVGSFIIPMAQYFWYVRDDDSSEQFFAAKKVPPPPPPKPVKKKWF